MARPLFSVKAVLPELWPPYVHTIRHPPVKVWVVDGRYLVQQYEVPDVPVRLSITSAQPGTTRRFADGIPWEDLQECKRVVGYGDMDALEVYPREDDVVDVANMRHLWLVPEGVAFRWRSS